MEWFQPRSDSFLMGWDICWWDARTETNAQPFKEILQIFQLLTIDRKDKCLMLPKQLVKKGFFLQALISVLGFFFLTASCLHLLSLLSCFILCVLCVSVVLTAAVTQASLQSMLHKILTAGPSAFNITTLLSQATQLSSQGTYTHSAISLVLLFTFKPAVFFIRTTMPSKSWLWHVVLRLAVLWPDLELHNLSSWFWFVLAWGCVACVVDSCQLWGSESASLS